MLQDAGWRPTFRIRTFPLIITAKNVGTTTPLKSLNFDHNIFVVSERLCWRWVFWSPVKVNDNGKINNYEEEIGADGKVITTDTTPVDYQGEPMPEPAKRVSNADYGDYGGRK